MGAAKNAWMAEMERIADEYINGDITENEAIKELRRLGYYEQEAKDYLNHAEEHKPR